MSEQSKKALDRAIMNLVRKDPLSGWWRGGDEERVERTKEEDEEDETPSTR